MALWIVINLVEAVRIHLVSCFCIEELLEDAYRRANFYEAILFPVDPSFNFCTIPLYNIVCTLSHFNLV